LGCLNTVKHVTQFEYRDICTIPNTWTVCVKYLTGTVQELGMIHNAKFVIIRICFLYIIQLYRS
jgi:hypothetical protein